MERSGRYDKIGFVSRGEFRFGCDRFARSTIGDLPEIGSVFESWVPGGPGSAAGTGWVW